MAPTAGRGLLEPTYAHVLTRDCTLAHLGPQAPMSDWSAHYADGIRRAGC
jgi:hypothetical protein